MTRSTETQQFTVPSEGAGARLDHALTGHLKGFSRSRFQSWIRAGQVRVNGDLASRPGLRLKPGDEVTFTPPADRVATTPTGRPIQTLDVIFEDEHLAVIHKPAGLLVHATDRVGGGTVADLAQERFGTLPEVQGENRPGIVHRLDRLTSGVMLLGRTVEALEALKGQFQRREVRKTYLALCHGEPRFDNEWVRVPIGVDQRHRDRRRAAVEGEGREAQTLVQVCDRLEGFSLVAAHPKTGRTHQLRVHLAHLGHPILGDRTYRHPGALPVPIPAQAPDLQRQALHAARIEFMHPSTGKALTFGAPLPQDMRAMLTFLRKRAGKDPDWDPLQSIAIDF